MKNQGKYRDRAAAKFIVLKLRELTLDNRHRVRYEDNLNNVISDIFKVKAFTRRLAKARNDYDAIYVLNYIGIDKLLDICNSGEMYDAIGQMIAMDFRISQIKYRFRKLNKAGKKRPKQMVKEYNWLTDIYPDACKAIRKKYGIKDSDIGYKKRFRSVSDIVKSKKNGFFDDDFDEMFFDDWDDDDDYENDFFYGDEYDRDRDGESEFERFMKKYSKSNRENRSSKRKQSRERMESRRDFTDWAEEDDYDWDDDIEDPFEEKFSDPRIDRLEAIVSDVVSTMQYLKNVNTQYVPQQPQGRPVQKRQPCRQQPQPSPQYQQMQGLPRNASKEQIDAYYFKDFADRLSHENAELKGMMRTLVGEFNQLKDELYEEEYEEPMMPMQQQRPMAPSNQMWNKPMVGNTVDPVYGNSEDFSEDEYDPEFDASYEESVQYALTGNPNTPPSPDAVSPAEMIELINSNGYSGTEGE